MAKISRDVLIVSKLSYLSDSALEMELDRITRLLYDVESSESYYQAIEIIDLPRYRIIRKPLKVKEALHRQSTKPFVFICNKN
jgi:hypothetical protein